MPTLVAANLTKKEFEMSKSPRGSSSGGGDIESGALVSLDVKALFVDVGSSTPSELLALGVPTCCAGSSDFFSLCGVCCLLTVVLPLAVFLPLSRETPLFGVVAYVLLGLGVAYVLWSLRVTLMAGAITMPAAPARASAFVAHDSGPEELRAALAPPKRLYVIVNPHGGLQKGPRALKEVVLPIWTKEFGIEVTVLETQYAGHARDLARTVDLKGYDGLCVIGGDGSVHEVVNGLLQRPKTPGVPLPPVGLLPGGSGNSVMLDLGTWSMAEAARRIGRGDVVHIDAVQCATAGLAACSINLVAWGLVGDVGVVAEKFRCLGPARYDIVAVWGVAKGGGWPCKLTYELESGQRVAVDEKLMTAFVNSTQHFGKGLRPTPNARLDDGLMDLCYLEVGTWLLNSNR